MQSLVYFVSIQQRVATQKSSIVLSVPTHSNPLTLLAPNTGVSSGECNSSLVGPFIGFHHNSVLISGTCLNPLLISSAVVLWKGKYRLWSQHRKQPHRPSSWSRDHSRGGCFLRVGLQHKIPVQSTQLSLFNHRVGRNDASSTTGSSVFADQSAHHASRRRFSRAERSVSWLDSVWKLLYDRSERR